jgi:hemin uptake protein HemP
MDPHSSHTRNESKQGGAAPDSTFGRTVTSSELFGPSRELFITHQGTYYRLRITKSGKLILTK